MKPMHPMTSKIVTKEGVRHMLQKAWLESVGDARCPLPLQCISEIPLVMSEELNTQMGKRVAQLCIWLQRHIDRGRWAQDPLWPDIGRPNVLTADIAIVHEPDSPGGWGLRWVEFQAFDSVAVTVYGLHCAWQSICPPLRNIQPYELPKSSGDWIQTVQKWAAPSSGILLEWAAYQQTTAFDLLARAKVMGMELIEPSQLRLQDSRLERMTHDGSWEDVRHVLNRLILHDDPQRETTQRILSQAKVSWHNHPAWFARIHKGLLPEFPMPAHERCARADRWRELNVSADHLVLKSSQSWGGAQVHLHVSEQDLDTLPQAHNWIVQPRYAPFPLAMASDGAALYGEVRYLVALPVSGPPWIASRFARLSRGPMASSRSWSGLPGEGVAPVYAPLGARGVFDVA